MKNKYKLRHTHDLKNVYIEKETPQKERQYEANVRLLVRTLAEGKLQVKGDRLTKAGVTDHDDQQAHTTQNGWTGRGNAAART